jgi:hypothetical protein
MIHANSHSTAGTQPTPEGFSGNTRNAKQRLMHAIRKPTCGLLFGLVALLMGVPGLHAQSFPENTNLINIIADSELAEKVREISYDSYTLSDGTPVSFRKWYTSKLNDISLTWMTEINNNFGVYWGFSTGERGEKYRIQPGFKIGFLVQTELSRSGTISFSATTVLAGMLTEKPCVADYGAIGGIQVVNCRLAASPLPPAETLQYLFNDPPKDHTEMTFRYQLKF